MIYPLLERFHIDAEDAHHGVIGMLHMIEKNPQLLYMLEKLITVGDFQYTNERLETTVGGVKFPNPILLPAGYDKNAEAINALFALGFGAVEVGTVPLHAQHGNPRPRVFRPAKDTVLNRYGFNSEGAPAVANNLQRYGDRKGTLGVSVGMNTLVSREDAPQAHQDALAEMLEYGDFFTINVSSPNTDGLRALQTYEHMKGIVGACLAEMQDRQYVKPLFIKLAPDLPLEFVDEITRLAEEFGLAGLMLTNTTIDPQIKANLGEKWKGQAGGVSGKPLRELSTRLIKHVHKTAPNVPVIGMGGVSDLKSALEKFEAGASSVGLLSSLIFSGPSLPSTLLVEIDTWLQARGVANISEIVGVRI